jgi:RNA polymerase sigma-70 factor (ECF subfamily)
MHAAVSESAAMSDSPEDVVWLRRAAGGDSRAASLLFRMHGARVQRMAARVLGAGDAEVDDVVQQTFLAALDGAARFDGRSALSTWLVGIANRRALDAARSRARRARLREVTSWFGFGAAAPAASEAHDARDSATGALAVLTPDQRSVFVLVSVEGYTLQEAADMTGIGISTLHARLAAARKKLDAAGSAEEEGVR